MNIFKKKADNQENIDSLIESYGGNDDIEAIENNFLSEVMVICESSYRKQQKELQIRLKIDVFTDKVIETLLKDEQVISIIRENKQDDTSIWEKIANAFRKKD